MVQSNNYYKSHAVGVMSEVSLTTDQDLVECCILKKHDVFHTIAIPEVMRYETLYNILFNSILLGGARGIMVIVIGNGHGNKSSNPGQDWLHFT